MKPCSTPRRKVSEMSDDTNLIQLARNYLSAFSPRVVTEGNQIIQSLADALERVTKALSAINDIRNSIIGAQQLNWSEHVYPMVAALDEAGMKGLPWAEARANMGTLLQRAQADRAEAERLRADAERYRFIREHSVCIWETAECKRRVVEFATVPCESKDDLDAAIDAAKEHK